MNDLEYFFESSEHRRMVKWRHYFDIYERHLRRFRSKPVTMLEIGVFDGGSLQMWQYYFGSKARIVGLDSDPRCQSFAGGNIQIVTGDQADRGLLQRLSDDVGGFDIVIDDGGHRMNQQITSFEVLYPRIHDQGVYICEDLHTSYWQEFGGGLREPGTFIEYSKRLIDELNAWYSGNAAELSPTDFTRNTFGLHFYDSMLVVEKCSRPPPVACDSGPPKPP